MFVNFSRTCSVAVRTTKYHAARSWTQLIRRVVLGSVVPRQSSVRMWLAGPLDWSNSAGSPGTARQTFYVFSSWLRRTCGELCTICERKAHKLCRVGVDNYRISSGHHAVPIVTELFLFQTVCGSTVAFQTFPLKLHEQHLNTATFKLIGHKRLLIANYAAR